MKAAYKIGAINVMAFFLFLADRALKFLAENRFFEGRNWGLGNWFRLELAYNQGVAFGIPLNYYFIVTFYCAVILILVWYLIDLYRSRTFWPIFASTIILLGAFSNFLDRIYFGKVIDYLYLKNFSVFNLSDAMITIGAILLIITTGHKSDKK